MKRKIGGKPCLSFFYKIGTTVLLLHEMKELNETLNEERTEMYFPEILKKEKGTYFA